MPSATNSRSTPPHHRLRRQRVVPVPQLVVQPGVPSGCCANSASTSNASRPHSIATFTPRLACRAACFSTRGLRPRCAGSGDAQRLNADEAAAGTPTPSRLPTSCRTFRSRRRARRNTSRSIPAERDPLAGHSRDEKIAILKRTSYRDYLTKLCGCSDEVANLLQGRTLGFFGLGADAVPAEDVRDLGYPGFPGPRPAAGKRGLERALHLSLPRRQCLARAPDGARADPGCRAGKHHGRRGPAPFDYAQARRGATNVRIRLDSTCHRRAQRRRRSTVGYSRSGAMHRIAARHAVLACFHMVIPHIMPELSEPQCEALRANVKTPLVYTNVLVRNWRSLAAWSERHFRAGVVSHQVSLDFPVSLGGYRHTRDPASRSACTSSTCRARRTRGSTRARSSASVRAALAMTFADFEARIRDDLDRMLGLANFPARATLLRSRSTAGRMAMVMWRTRSRPGRLRGERAQTGTPPGRPRRHRQHRFWWRRLGAFCDRSGRASSR